MTLPLIPNFFVQFLDDDGNPLSNGKLYSYSAGTSTPKATYSDPDGLVPNANPVVLDANGRAVVYIDGTYRFVLKDAAGNTIKDGDSIYALGDINFTADDLSVDNSAFTILTGGTVQEVLQSADDNIGNFQSKIQTAALSEATVASDDQVLIRDVDDDNQLKYVLASTLAALSAGGLTFVAELAAGTGTSVQQTDIPAGKIILVLINGVSTNFGSSNTLRVEISDDNGGSYGSAITISPQNGSAGNGWAGILLITRTNETASKTVMAITATNSAGATSAFTGTESTKTGITNALRFSPSGNNFDAGSFQFWVLK